MKLLFVCVYVPVLNHVYVCVFQCNGNEISGWDDINHLMTLKSLSTIYLEHNPLWADPDNPKKESPHYRRKMILLLPWLKQIDATFCR